MRPDSSHVTRCSPSPNFGDRRGKTVDTLIIHYTGLSSGGQALAHLCNPASEVSCHYFVWEDGLVDQLVAERDRAWHAGRSFWHGETDMNAVSIGIELVNPGHRGGYLPYPAAQMEAAIALCGDIRARHAIPPERVLAHSDIAPERKIDPGEWFPWRTFAAAGLGRWIAPAPLVDGPVFQYGDEGEEILALQADLRALGFASPRSGVFCAETETIVTAFQRHHRPARVDGRADSSTRTTLQLLLQGAG